MTKISYVSGVGAGIPTNEFADRGREVTTAKYIPFLSQTVGQTQVDIMRNLAVSLAQWSQDPTWRRAAVLLDNASVAGVHRFGYIGGVLSDAELWAAGVIDASRRATRPSVKTGQMPVYSRIAADPLIQSELGIVRANRAFVGRYYNVLMAAGYVDFINKANSADGYSRKDIAWKVFDDNRIGTYDRDAMRTYYYNQIERYNSLYDVEQIYNKYLPDSSHHVLYFPIQEAYNMPDRVFTKRALHMAGVDGLAGSAEVTTTLIRTWVGASIVATNLQGGAGNLNPIQTAFGVAGAQGDALLASYLNQFPNDKSGKINGPHVGLAQVVVLAIISLVSAAVTAAAKIVGDIQKTKQLALTQAKGFGTPALSAATTDWTAKGSSTSGAAGSSSNLLLLGGLAAGAYFLLNDD